MDFLRLLLVGSQIFTTKMLVESTKDSKKYCATSNDALVQSLGATASTNVTTESDNLTTVYFKNLNNNVAFNYFGTCSYVAMEMLLSYYDTFYNDGFIDEKYEQNEIIDTANGKSVIDTESPAIKIDNYGNLFSNFPSDFNQYIREKADTYFEYYLLDMFGYNPTFEGLSLYEQVQNLRRYIMFKSGVSPSDAYIESCNTSNTSEMKQFITEKVEKGIPVVINCNHPMMGRHTMIAYEMDYENNTYFVHTGFKDFEGKAISHLSLKDLEGVTIESAYCINYSGDVWSSDNYRHSYGYPISQANLFNVNNLKSIGKLYIDCAPTFKWNNNMVEAMASYRSNLRVTITDSAGKVYVNQLLGIDAKQYTMPYSVWEQLIYNEKPTFNVKVEAIFDEYSVANYAIVNTTTQFNRPTEYASTRLHVITPDDWGYTGNTSNTYVIDETSKTNLVKGQTNDGFEFYTTRYRTRRDPDYNCLVMSPIHKETREAYVEYTFAKPIDKMDFEMSIWTTLSKEKIDPSTTDLKVQIYKSGSNDNHYMEYIDVKNMWSEPKTLKSDKEMQTYSLTFEQPVNRVKFLIDTNKTNTQTKNLGRICIGNMYVIETPNCSNQEYIAPSGYELEHDLDFFNSSRIKAYSNCYGFALNIRTGHIFKPGPGHSGGYNSQNFKEYYRAEVIERLAMLDGENCGFTFKKIDKHAKCSEGNYKVALVITGEKQLSSDGFHYEMTPNAKTGMLDFHWYRQNKDGTWSHKPGSGLARDWDYYGNVILDPENINPEVENDGYDSNYYNEFVGFYEVESADGKYFEQFDADMSYFDENWEIKPYQF